jgi:polyisoprenyl-phosphate glycosyltransferase
MGERSPAVTIPTNDAAAALEFCRRLASAVSDEQALRWPAEGGEGTPTPEVSVVIPIFNEHENIPELYARLTGALDAAGIPFELILVNDGSTDTSLTLLESLAHTDPRVVIVDLSRNFGHQVAISAGLECSRGKAVIIMDGDLQDPPEVLPAFMEKWREGNDVVYAIRQQRKENLLKRTAYAAFYRILQWIAHVNIPLDSGDFCLMDRRVVDLLVRMPERNRFLRGIRSWLGFTQVGLAYERHARAAGQPKYTIRKLLYLAADGLLSFSYMPLRMISVMGMGVSILSVALAIYYALKKLVFALDPPGFATLIVALFFLSGVQLITIGVMAEYVGRISDEVKRRPMFVIRRIFRGGGPSPS